jgi:hypothetical protein
MFCVFDFVYHGKAEVAARNKRVAFRIFDKDISANSILTGGFARFTYSESRSR